MEELIAVAAVKCIVDSPYVQEVVARNKIIPLVK
jgi:Tfp pilus assembly major pilin PilA